MKRLLPLFLLFAACSVNAFGADKPDTNKAPPPKNNTRDSNFESTIAAVETKGASTEITLQNSDVKIGLRPETELVREERELTASQLQVGDTLLRVTIKGQKSKFNIQQKVVVAGLNPLIIRIGEMATLTVLQTDSWEFIRVTPIKAADLKIGQTVAVEMNIKRDGAISTKRVVVLIGKREPTKRKPKTAAPPKEKPAAGNN